MKKFELTTESIIRFGKKLYRIRALIDFGSVRSGDLGGYIEKENNLSHDDNAWVYGDAQVCDNAWVYGDAQVCGNAWVSGNAQVSGNAWVYGDAQVSGNAQVCGNAQVHGNAWVYGDAQVCGNAWVYGDAQVCGNAWVYGNAFVKSNDDYICLKGFGSKNRNTTMFRAENGKVFVKCGCFSGTLEEFEKQVKETHGNSKYAKEYLACVEVAKIHFEIV